MVPNPTSCSSHSGEFIPTSPLNPFGVLVQRAQQEPQQTPNLHQQPGGAKAPLSTILCPNFVLLPARDISQSRMNTSQSRLCKDNVGKTRLEPLGRRVGS